MQLLGLMSSLEEEKEGEVANLTARMVGVNNQAQQVAGANEVRTKVVGQTQQPNRLGTRPGKSLLHLNQIFYTESIKACRVLTLP